MQTTARRIARRCGFPAARVALASPRRAWLSTTYGTEDENISASATGAAQEPDGDPDLLALRRMENMQAFEAFREVARGFRWPNEEPPGDTTAKVAGVGSDTVTETKTSADVRDSEAGFSATVDKHAGQGDDYGIDRDQVFVEEDLFGEDGEPKPFHELMAFASQEMTTAPNMKGRKNFGRVIRKDISERDVLTLSMFVNELGRIQPRHVTGLTSKQQRKVAKMVKRARHMGVMPHMFRLPPEFAFTSPLHDMAEIERVKSWEESRAERG